MAGNFRAAASERNPDLSTVRAIEKAIWLKKAHYPTKIPVAACGMKEMQEFPTATLPLHIQS